MPALLREIARDLRRRPAATSTTSTLEEQEPRGDRRRHLGRSIKKAATRRRKQIVGAELLRRVERDIMLQIVDAQWKDHLYSLDHLKEGIGLRGYGQRDPLVEYKKESFTLFQDMKARIEEEMVRYLFWLRPVSRGAAAGRRCRAGRRPAAPTTAAPSSAADDDEQPARPKRVPAFAGARVPRTRRRVAPMPRRSRRAPVATTSSRPCAATNRRSAATIRARAAAARSTRSATVPRREGPHRRSLSSPLAKTSRGSRLTAVRNEDRWN